MIKLKKSNNFHYYKRHFNYEIIYDEFSGRKNRYNVIITNTLNPIFIGREITLKHSRDLISKYEKLALKLDNSNIDIFRIKTYHQLQKKLNINGFT
jgi:hypothetical protein